MLDSLQGMIAFGQSGLVLLAYLLGCINPSILLGKARGIDVRSQGSGNAGTTNTLRLMGKKAAAIALSVDILKGLAAVLLGELAYPDSMTAGYCALAVMVGHVFPVFYQFRGGKGVATAFGAMLMLDWRVALLALAVAALVTLISKRMSLGSVLAAVSLTVFTYFLSPHYIVIACAITIIVVAKHKANIQRLMRGEEPTLNFKK